MSRAFISNLMHLIDETGTIHHTLPPSKKKLAKHICQIVSTLTQPPQSTPIQCWNTCLNKKCTGKIAAGIDIETFHILWHCLVCGHHGSISKWEHSKLDQGYRA